MVNDMTIRQILALVVLLSCCIAPQVRADEPMDIGSRRELFVDNFLIDSMSGDVEQFVHEPQPKEVVLVTGESWEGNTCAYYTIFRDGDVYRMYYRGSHANEKLKGTHPEVTCYAESRDGVNWTKPKLGLHEWEGSKDNNIILVGSGTHCFVAFRDDNPNCSEDARYKGISRGGRSQKKGLYAFKSPDGVRWSPMQKEPIITNGAFDSQNLAFWDPQSKKYIDYHRTFVDGVRAIMMCMSDDYLKWTEPVLLKFPNTPKQHLYTNAIRTYERAPHIRIGFPTRYIPNGSQVEPVFMSSRDGLTFKRWAKPVIPRTAPKDRDGNRSNYMANALVQLPGDDRHYSVYGTEAYYAGPDSRLRRFVYRVDGFVSLQADKGGGQVVTKPVTFKGNELEVNFTTSDGGVVRVELLDEKGKPIDGFSFAECQPLSGDSIDMNVKWKATKNSEKSLSDLAGKTVQIRFQLKDANLYSFRFHD